jgi:hypothetical protein
LLISAQVFRKEARRTIQEVVDCALHESTPTLSAQYTRIAPAVQAA